MGDGEVMGEGRRGLARVGADECKHGEYGEDAEHEDSGDGGVGGVHPCSAALCGRVSACLRRRAQRRAWRWGTVWGDVEGKEKGRRGR